MSLYRCGGNRTALLDGIAELVLAELAIPANDGHDGWQGQLRHTAHNFRQVALHSRPLCTPPGLRPYGTLRPLEKILQRTYRNYHP